MARFRQSLVCLMVAVWLPATLHCAMDRAGLFEAALACCEHEKPARSTNAGQCDERCADFERSINKASAEMPAMGAPVLFALVDWVVVVVEVPAIPGAILPEVTDSPPELARTWHFVARAALPARAPSLA